MTKRKNKQNKKQNKSKQLTLAARRGLDAYAKAYARLLVDPCNAPLAYPVYGGSDGSYLVRCESYYTLGNVFDQTAIVVSWTPGGVGKSETAPTNNKAILSLGATSSTALTVLSAAGDSAPGAEWLRNNASAYRAVAACATVMYTGAELNRAGLVGYGCVPGALIGEKYFDDQQISAQGVLSSLPNGDKTPASSIEVVWYPSDNDSLFHNPDDSAADELLARRNAIVVSAVGLPANAGLTFKLVAVYEYKPKYGTGIVQAARTTRSSASLGDVLNFINAAAGNPWVRAGASALVGFMAPNRVRHRIEL